MVVLRNITMRIIFAFALRNVGASLTALTALQISLSGDQSGVSDWLTSGRRPVIGQFPTPADRIRNACCR